MTLSKNQRKYRERKKKQKTDFHRVPREDGSGKMSQKIANKQLCVRISHASYDKLKALAEDWGYTLTEMLTHIINVKTDSYLSEQMGCGVPHYWNKELLVENRGLKRKRAKQDKMLNLSVTSTAFKSLQSHANDHGVSKARLVEEFIRDYTPVPKHQLEANRKRRAEMTAYYEERKGQPSPLEMMTDEEKAEAVARFDKAMAELEERRGRNYQ